jgi:hypothetical protein
MRTDVEDPDVRKIQRIPFHRNLAMTAACSSPRSTSPPLPAAEGVVHGW